MDFKIEKSCFNDVYFIVEDFNAKIEKKFLDDEHYNFAKKLMQAAIDLVKYDEEEQLLVDAWGGIEEMIDYLYENGHLEEEDNV